MAQEHRNGAASGVAVKVIHPDLSIWLGSPEAWARDKIPPKGVLAITVTYGPQQRITTSGLQRYGCKEVDGLFHFVFFADYQQKNAHYIIEPLTQKIFFKELDALPADADTYIWRFGEWVSDHIQERSLVLAMAS